MEMRFSGMKCCAVCFIGVTAIVLGFVSAGNLLAEEGVVDQQSGGEYELKAPPPVEKITYQNYSGLSELITRVCDEAAEQFYGFFDPTVVMVKPFMSVTDTGEKRLSLLGVTLADQMIAMINNDPAILQNTAGVHQQDLKGVLQEMDGYLRIHISGMNSHASRRSYVVTVEMSEAIYRSLHTYIDG